MVRCIQASWALLLLLPATTAAAAPSAEDELAAAENLYFAGKYEDALLAMEELSRREGVTTAVVERALKYAAFCYLLMDAESQAVAAWRRLLVVHPGYPLDPETDAPRFVEFFNQIAPAPKPQPGSPQAVVPAAPAIETPPVRGCGVVLCLVPFGAGQFANGHVLKGILAASLETIFLGFNIGLFAVNKSEYDANGGRFVDRNRAEARNAAQHVFFGLFAVTVALGVADAFLLP